MIRHVSSVGRTGGTAAAIAVAGSLAAFGVAGCFSTDRTGATADAGAGGASNERAAQVVARFQEHALVRERLRRAIPLEQRSGGFRAVSVLPKAGSHGYWRPAGGRAETTLPTTAGGATRLAFAGDPDLWIEITSLDDRPVVGERSGEFLVHANAAEDVDVLRMAHAYGAEEFRVLRSERARSSFRYRVSHGAGIRDLHMVDGRPQAIDTYGVARFEMEAAWVDDAVGHSRGASISIERREPDSVVRIDVDVSNMVFPLALDPSWNALTAMGAKRTSPFGTVLVDGRFLVAGGDQSDSGSAFFLSSAETYDPSTNKWSPAGSMSYPRRTVHSAQFTNSVRLLDGRVLVAGVNGGTGSGQSVGEVFDPTTGTWTQTGATVSVIDSEYSLVVLDSNRVLAVCGVAQILDTKTLAWRAAKNSPALASGSTPATIPGPDGNVYLFGGGSYVQVFDPVAETWSVVAISTTPLGCGGGGLAGGYAAGRFLQIGYYVCAYDAVMSTFAVPPVSGIHPGWIATLLSGAFLEGDALDNNQVALFDPTAMTWSSMPALAVARQDPALGTLPSGSVIVAGGTDGMSGQTLSTAERFQFAALVAGQTCGWRSDRDAILMKFAPRLACSWLHEHHRPRAFGQIGHACPDGGDGVATGEAA